MWLNVYHNAEGKEEFGEKPFLSLPKKAFCEFMKSTYKDKLYESIKDYSNLPSPDECPVKAVNIQITFLGISKQLLHALVTFRTISPSKITHSVPASIRLSRSQVCGESICFCRKTTETATSRRLESAFFHLSRKRNLKYV